MGQNVEVLNDVKAYYDKKLEDHGPTPAGVDWNDLKSQTIRFIELIKVINGDDYFSIIDFGCGYGALCDYLLACKKNFTYYGFDLSENMLLKARNAHRNHKQCVFIDNIDHLSIRDYTIASGIFNVKLSTDPITWQNYMLFLLDQFNEISKKGFSFNCLTSYADKPLMKDYLYYADPLFFFDYCKKNYSRNVTLLHDYDLYEFTILVKKIRHR